MLVYNFLSAHSGHLVNLGRAGDLRETSKNIGTKPLTLMHDVTNDQTHFKNLAANTVEFLKCVWPFWDIMH